VLRDMNANDDIMEPFPHRRHHLFFCPLAAPPTRAGVVVVNVSFNSLLSRRFGSILKISFSGW